MPAINQVVENLGELEPTRFPILVSDCDGTLFPHGSTELFPDANAFIDEHDPEVIMLVSANPDKALAQKRAEAVKGGVIIPRVPNWVKHGLFRAAAHKIKQQTDADRALVLGDRWAMDVAVARYVLFRSGIDNQGVLVKRPEGAKRQAIDHVVSPIQSVAAHVLKFTGHDHFIRPRKEEATIK